LFTDADAAASSQQKKLYKVQNLSDEDSTLLEPAACAIHGLDKLAPPVGIEVLLLGAGPTGLILAQLLKLNGASRVVIAANKGIKMDIAKDLDAGDEYIELDRANPEAQWKKLKDDNPYGFDVVVEATGVEKLANESINYVRRGGTLMIYGVYENKALVHWPPSKVCFSRLSVLRNVYSRSTDLRRRDQDHRVLLADPLLPARGGVPRQRKGPRQGHGHRLVQARRLPARAGQNEQPGRAQDLHQALIIEEEGWT
jgi:threonine dehydrogenase-like Zn-dependent dehydrogenase